MSPLSERGENAQLSSAKGGAFPKTWVRRQKQPAGAGFIKKPTFDVTEQITERMFQNILMMWTDLALFIINWVQTVPRLRLINRHVDLWG